MIWKAMVLDVYENEIQACFLCVLVSSSRIVPMLHITFSWLPLPIGQVCSQVWCRPYLAAHFGFSDLRTFPWSLSQVQVSTFVSTFYPFTPKVGSKWTYIILTSSSVKPSIGLNTSLMYSFQFFRTMFSGSGEFKLKQVTMVRTIPKDSLRFSFRLDKDWNPDEPQDDINCCVESNIKDLHHRAFYFLFGKH